MSEPFSCIVAAALVELGRATADDIHRKFPERTLRQVFKALQNCRQQGKAELISKGKPNSNGRSTFGVWVPVLEEEDPTWKPLQIGFVSSVFELGAPRKLEQPLMRGTVWSPLGGWLE